MIINDVRIIIIVICSAMFFYLFIVHTITSRYKKNATNFKKEFIWYPLNSLDRKNLINDSMNDKKWIRDIWVRNMLWHIFAVHPQDFKTYNRLYKWNTDHRRWISM